VVEVEMEVVGKEEAMAGAALEEGVREEVAVVEVEMEVAGKEEEKAEEVMAVWKGVALMEVVTVVARLEAEEMVRARWAEVATMEDLLAMGRLEEKAEAQAETVAWGAARVGWGTQADLEVQKEVQAAGCKLE